MRRPLPIEVTDLARAQIRAAQDWCRVKRPKVPNAIRDELQRASLLISVQPEIGARATNISLAGVRRLHLARVRYHVYYRVVAVLAFLHESRGSDPSLRKPSQTLSECSRRPPTRATASRPGLSALIES